MKINIANKQAPAKMWRELFTLFVSPLDDDGYIGCTHVNCVKADECDHCIFGISGMGLPQTIKELKQQNRLEEL